MSAVEAVKAEAGIWAQITRRLDRIGGTMGGALDPPFDEMAVTGFDAGSDLERRARRWDHALPSTTLPHVTAFASALAEVEAHAWETDDAMLATRAFEDRRFLASDRVVHWAVPWADVAGRCHPAIRDDAHRIRDDLLDIGERLRPAPILTGDEGLHPPGEDSYGPMSVDLPIEEHIRLLGSGTVVFTATVTSLLGRAHQRRLDADELTPDLLRDLASLYDSAAVRWRAMAGRHPGSARLWVDLATRATCTTQAISDRS